jgi:hypothetical protein
MESLAETLGLEELLGGLGLSIGLAACFAVVAFLAIVAVLILTIVLIVKGSKPKPNGAGRTAPRANIPVAAQRMPPPRPVAAPQVPRAGGAPAPAFPAVGLPTAGGAAARWGLRVLQGGASVGQVYPLDGDAVAGRGDGVEGPHPGFIEDGGRWTRLILLDMSDRAALAKQCSRRHFRIRERKGADGTFDVSVANRSQNPVWVDGKILRAEGESAEAREGTVVELAPDWKLQLCRIG